MQDRRQGARHVVSFPIRVKWKNEDGKVVTEEGLTENVGINGALVYLPRKLPTVGSKVDLTVTENAKEEVTGRKKFGILQPKPLPGRSLKSWMTGKL
jgi:hypothetical protein